MVLDNSIISDWGEAVKLLNEDGQLDELEELNRSKWGAQN